MSPIQDDALDDGALFDMKPEPTRFLRDRYLEPTFTVLDRRGGAWLDRDRKWKALGIRSEVGREDGLTFTSNINFGADYNEGADKTADGEQRASTSIFSPTLAELMLRWYSRTGDAVFDPFAGGSVRGIVSGTLDRPYTGLELRPEQVQSNNEQRHIVEHGPQPTWIAGDSAQMDALLPANYQADMVLSCPPYAYLEKYSDDPHDLSSMDYQHFLVAYRHIIKRTVARVRDDRFIAWIVGEVREKGGDGSLVGLIPDTVQAFRDAGAEPYNDHIVLTPIGSAMLRAPRLYETSRKACRIHEYALVFIKGNARTATKRLNGPAFTEDPPTAAPADDEGSDW